MLGKGILKNIKLKTMPTTIKCNKCGNEIEISEALKKDLEEKIGEIIL